MLFSAGNVKKNGMLKFSENFKENPFSGTDKRNKILIVVFGNSTIKYTILSC